MQAPIAINHAAPKVAVVFENGYLGRERFARDDAEPGKRIGKTGRRNGYRVELLSVRVFSFAVGHGDFVTRPEEAPERFNVISVLLRSPKADDRLPSIGRINTTIGHQKSGPVGAMFGDFIKCRIVQRKTAFSWIRFAESRLACSANANAVPPDRPEQGVGIATNQLDDLCGRHPGLVEAANLRYLLSGVG